MISDINAIIYEYNKFEEIISDFLKNQKKFFLNLLDNVKIFKDWLKKKKRFNREEFKTIKNDFSTFYNKFNTIISESKFISKLNELNKDIDNISKKEVIPENDNNISKSIIDINVSITKDESNNDSNTNNTEDYFIGEKNENDLCNDFSYLKENENSPLNISNISNNNNIKNESKKIIFENKDDEYKDNKDDNFLKCSECRLNKAINICSHCNKLYCNPCYDFISKYETFQNHKISKIPDNQLEIENSKDILLKNLISLFKNYLMKLNYLLKSKLIFDIPKIDNVSDLECQINYLKEFNNLYSKNENIDNSNENNYEKEEIDGRLMRELETIFKDKKLHISEDINDIDSDFYSDEKCNITDVEFDKIKNKLLYFITIISNENLELGNINDTLISKMYNYLGIEKNNIFILINDKISNYVKSTKFNELDYKQFELKNPIYNKLNELKLLIDELLKNECNISNNYLDSKGNTINPNSSNNLIRGTERYDPPYGWIGIGLNVIGKYDNNNNEWLTNNSDSSEWAIAYHGISPKIQSNIVKKLLKYIITKNSLKKDISKIKSNINDKRNWGKVGDGIYLTPNITIAEHYTGIIPFNNKRYKVLFMARVYIKGIREPEHSNFWVLDEKYIRIYRILFKEI